MIKTHNLSTKVLTVVLLFHLFQTIHGNSPILVLKSGVKPFGPEATTLTFYATVENKGLDPLAVGLEMERCCQNVSDNDIDCDSMKLHSELRVELFPAEFRNITIYYTNRYLHGRKGDCWLKVKWRLPGSKTTSSDQIQINFDTRLPVLFLIQKLFSHDPRSQFTICESPDDDPRRNCKPVNCLVKYSGYRSFYNRTERKCQQTPKCVDLATFTTKMEKRPDVITSPISNRCKNLKSIKFSEEMKELEDVVEVAALSYKNYPIHVQCVHGHRNGSEGLCICDTGWTSKSFPGETFNPERDTFVMCNQGSLSRVENSNALMVSQIILICLVILLLLILCIYCPCLCRRYSALRKIESMSSELATSTPSNSESSIISEVKSRREVILPPVSPIPTKTKMVEFSNLLQEEQTTHPAPSKNPIIQAPLEMKSKPLYLRYPQSFQLKPRVRSPSPLPPTTPTQSPTSSSTSISQQWSIPDTSEASSSHTCYPGHLIPLVASCSIDSFPRPLGVCSCCNNTNELEPLVSVRVNTTDRNRNTVITMKNVGPLDQSISFENMRFPGPTPQHINKIVDFSQTLDNLMNEFDPKKIKDRPNEVSSSTLSTLSHFWENDVQSEMNNLVKTHTS